MVAHDPVPRPESICPEPGEAGDRNSTRAGRTVERLDARDRRAAGADASGVAGPGKLGYGRRMPDYAGDEKENRANRKVSATDPPSSTR